MMENLYRNILIRGFETVVKRRATFRYLKDLEESQWLSSDELKTRQFLRLKSLIDYCFANSEYYRKLWSQRGLRPEDLTSLDDYLDWPTVSREEMRDNSSVIRVLNQNLRVVSKATGGSSGTPLRFTIDSAANERRSAAALRGYAWAGATLGSRQTHLWGIPLQLQSIFKRMKEHVYQRGLYGRDVVNSFELSESTVPTILQQINRFRPQVIVAYTNPLYSLAREIERQRLTVVPPKSIIVGAEKLHGFQRELIERVFSTRVFETYGSREFTLIGAECDKHAGMHLTQENLLVEILDENDIPTPEGQEGNIVITDLFNMAMPFVRYKIGDRAIAGLGSCECGRGLPLLRKVVGRQLDVLVTCDGRHVAGEFFPHLLKDYTSVRQFQVVQNARDLVELNLVVANGWCAAEREALRSAVQKQLGSATQLSIQEVDSIELTKLGKLRVVVSRAG